MERNGKKRNEIVQETKMEKMEKKQETMVVIQVNSPLIIIIFWIHLLGGWRGDR